MAIPTRSRLWFGALLCAFSVAAVADNALTTESADLYAGPDDSYPVVAQLDADTPIQVMGCLDDWSWCDVSVEGARGWLYSPDITYAYQGDYVPLYSYAPALGIVVVPFVIDDYWGRYYHGRPWYSRRDDWGHREMHHRRPSGPPPSASLPPRSEHREGPREAARPSDHPIHLGNAEPPRRDAHRPPEQPRAEPHAMTPAPNPPPHEPPRPGAHENEVAPGGHTEHPRPEDHPHPERAEPPKHEENPH